ncbi:MAG TPA: SEL1-like repeat protein [Gammaproteobacteria bacterium]|nr:SEL1-like repeat protein [Gammaproteobacteria bacterium]
MDKKDTRETINQSFGLIQTSLSTSITESKDKKFSPSPTILPTPAAPSIKELQQFISSTKDRNIGKPYELWLEKNAETPRLRILSISNTLALIQQDTGYFGKLPKTQLANYVADLLQLLEKTVAPLSTYSPIDEQTIRIILSSLDCLTNLPSTTTLAITRTSACLLTNLCRIADNFQLSDCLSNTSINALLKLLEKSIFTDNAGTFQQILSKLKYLIEISAIQDDDLLDFKSIFFILRQTLQATNEPQILSEVVFVAKTLIHYKPASIDTDFKLFRPAIHNLLETCKQPTKSKGDSKNNLSEDNKAKAIGKILLNLGAINKGQLLYAQLTEEDFQVFDELLEQLFLVTQKKNLDRESSWHIVHALLGAVWLGQPKLGKDSKDISKKLADQVETYISAEKNQAVFSYREFLKLTNQLIYHHYARREKPSSWPLVLQTAIKKQRPLIKNMTVLMQGVRDRLADIKKSPKKYQKFTVSFIDPEFGFGPFFVDIFLKVITPHQHKNLRLSIEDNGSTHEGIIAAGKDFLRTCLIKLNDDADEIVDIDTWQHSFSIDDVMDKIEQTVSKYDKADIISLTEKNEKRQRLCHLIVPYLSQAKELEVLDSFTTSPIPILNSTSGASTASSSASSVSSSQTSLASEAAISKKETPKQPNKDKIYKSKTKPPREKKSKKKKIVTDQPRTATSVEPTVPPSPEDKKRTFQTIKDYSLGVINFRKPDPKISDLNPKQALQLYLKSHRSLQRIFNLARQDDPAAQKTLGDLYTHGLVNLKPDKKAAAAWYRLAAEQEYPPAQYNLAICYYHGYGVEQDRKEAFTWCKEAAENNFSQAQFDLGLFYQQGEGASKNDKEAIAWLTKAAEQNNPDAQFELGNHYFFKQGVEQNLPLALELYRKAAAQGLPLAEFYLGFCYYYGKGVNKNFETAIIHLQKSVEQGCSLGFDLLGLCYREKKDFNTAFKFFKQGAAQNNAWSQLYLAGCYEEAQGTDQDLNAAFYWNNEAAKLGLIEAQYKVGVFYLHGIGTPKDEKTGFNCLKKLADQHCPEAECEIALCYRDGKGTQVDISLAFDYLKRAAEKNFPKAQSNLATCYMWGLGTPINEKLAFTNFQKAAKGGILEAQIGLAICYFNGEGVGTNRLLAAESLTKGIARPSTLSKTMGQQLKTQILTQLETKAKSNPIIQYELGMLYERGWLVEKDTSIAISWYQKAAGQNHSEARKRCAVLTQLSTPKDKTLPRLARDTPIHNRPKAPDKKDLFTDLLQAAQQGNANAQCELACCYYKGENTKIDLLKALEWFHQAIQHPSEIRPNLQQKSEIYIGEILSRINQGVHEDDRESLYICGITQEKGWFTQKDESFALELYQAAAEKGHKEAEKCLNNLIGKTSATIGK